MSEQEKIELFARLRAGLKKATLRMLERKAKLGEPVIVADKHGNPVSISAKEALKLLSQNS